MILESVGIIFPIFYAVLSHLLSSHAARDLRGRALVGRVTSSFFFIFSMMSSSSLAYVSRQGLKNKRMITASPVIYLILKARW